MTGCCCWQTAVKMAMLVVMSEFIARRGLYRCMYFGRMHAGKSASFTFR